MTVINRIKNNKIKGEIVPPPKRHVFVSKVLRTILINRRVTTKASQGNTKVTCLKETMNCSF